MAKKALKGFADLRYNKLTANTAEAYTPSATQTKLPGAQSLTSTDTRQDYEIYADDGVYDSGSDYQSTELTITMAEMSLKDLADLAGAKYDEDTGVMEESSTDVPPEVALGFSGLMVDGGKRMFQYLCCKLKDYKADLNTKGSSNDINAYTLTFSCTGRAYDHRVRKVKDVEKGSNGALDISWLNTVTAEPAT